MGRMKERFFEIANLELEYLDFLERLFVELNWRVLSRRIDNVAAPYQPDLLVNSSDGQGPIAVELKLHRRDRIQPTLLRNAFEFLDRLTERQIARRGILVITQPIKHNYLAGIDSGIHEIWDLEVLKAKARGFPELASDLVELVRTAQFGTLNSTSDSPAMVLIADESPQMPELGAGAALAAELEASRAGRQKKAAQQFEALCQQALELLYGRDFAGWIKQAPIERGYQRLDLIARLVPIQGSFWSTVASDFRARYIVFEFKNYTGKITQDEIHTTEKYLFTTALRPVAIIVARKGASDSARRAMRGALREQGKLILCISLEELCGLLRGWDSGDDPTGLLVERLDEMLITIAR